MKQRSNANRAPSASSGLSRPRGAGTKGKTNILPILIVFVLGCVLVMVMLVHSISTAAVNGDVTPLSPVHAAEEFVVTRESPTKAEKDSPPANPAASEPNQHIIFSTECGKFQDWQSYVFFYHAWKVKQPGTVTRIVTGCKPDEEESMRKLHKERIATLSENFKVHFTPSFSDLGAGHYQTTKYFNKPLSVRHWFEHALGFPGNHDPAVEDSIVMLLDPDMVLTRPLVNEFSSADVMHAPKDEQPTVIRVTHGHPIAQRYGYGSGWLKQCKKNLTHVVGDQSPLYNMTMKEAENYSFGPPYILTGRDMYKIVSMWTEKTGKVYDLFGGFLSEMYGFSISAAHQSLPLTVFRGLMISDVEMNNEEGSRFLESVDRADVCKPLPTSNMPPVIHYCQRYALGRWFFGKYKLPQDFFACDSPLLRVPPEDLAVRYNYFIYPNTERTDYDDKRKSLQIKLNGFTACFMINGVNEAAEHFKRKYCPAGANFNKSYIFHENIPDSLLYSIEKKK